MKYCTGVLAFIVFLLSCSFSYSGQGSERIGILLVDGKTGEVVANADVTFEGGVIVQCIKAPCPQIEKKWIRNTDGDGEVTVTKDILQNARTLTTPGYRFRGKWNAIDHQISEEKWLIELDPEEEIDKGNIRLKLLEAKTRKQLSNRRVWFTRHPKANIWLRRPPDCLPSKCPEYWVQQETNRLGNIYYSLRMFPPPLGVWIYMEGYRFVQSSHDWIKTGRVFLEKSD
jgi:hypothetical protein